jgi:hypothetical protein
MCGITRALFLIPHIKKYKKIVNFPLVTGSLSEKIQKFKFIQTAENNF